MIRSSCSPMRGGSADWARQAESRTQDKPTSRPVPFQVYDLNAFEAANDATYEISGGKRSPDPHRAG